MAATRPLQCEHVVELGSFWKTHGLRVDALRLMALPYRVFGQKKASNGLRLWPQRHNWIPCPEEIRHTRLSGKSGRFSHKPLPFQLS